MNTPVLNALKRNDTEQQKDEHELNDNNLTGRNIKWGENAVSSLGNTEAQGSFSTRTPRSNIVNKDGVENIKPTTNFEHSVLESDFNRENLLGEVISSIYIALTTT